MSRRTAEIQADPMGADRMAGVPTVESQTAEYPTVATRTAGSPTAVARMEVSTMEDLATVEQSSFPT
jgi:hypothetical protein